MTSVDTSAEVTEKLYEFQRTSVTNMIAGNFYTSISKNGGTTVVQNTAEAIVLSVVWIYNALNSSNLGKFEQEKADLDTFLSYPSPLGP